MENLLVGIDIESMKWLDAKDLFISSCVNQNFIPHWPMTHLLRVANCSNNVPEAKWLCRVFEHNPPFISRTFLKWVETDPNSEWVPCAMFYAGVFSFDMNMIKQAAKIGDGFAQAYLARYGEIEDRFMWARLSAQQGNRGGLFALGQALVQALYLRRTSAKEGEKYESAASVFKRAAEMGHCEAMCKHAYNLEHTDPKQVLWLYEAGLRSQFGQFFEFLEIRLVDCNDWVSVYEFGRLLKKVEITFDNDNQKLLAIRAIELYDKWSSRAREAVYAWRIVSRRLMLHKDVAGIISRIVWDGRRTDYNEK